MPEIFKNLVAGEGQPVPTIAATTRGGLTLEQHSKLPVTLEKIDEGNWDVVVIQGQSQEAAMAEKFTNMRQSFQTGAAELGKRIKVKSPNARVVFYETWARHADYWQSPKADKAVGNDPTDMQNHIRKWYLHVAQSAQKLKAVVAPVGDAWQLNYQSANPIRLHAKDNSHPAFSGSYLAALVIYATIYQPPSLTLKYHGELDEAEAARLQMLASQAVKQSNAIIPR
ncbi:MAG: hypothetical protein K8R87_04780 [Verrucomicrobia bacterium]|nr:hypothetical protein [Verrucomicrobiota bacterium]